MLSFFLDRNEGTLLAWYVRVLRLLKLIMVEHTRKLFVRKGFVQLTTFVAWAKRREIVHGVSQIIQTIANSRLEDQEWSIIDT